MLWVVQKTGILNNSLTGRMEEWRNSSSIPFQQKILTFEVFVLSQSPRVGLLLFSLKKRTCKTARSAAISLIRKNKIPLASSTKQFYLARSSIGHTISSRQETSRWLGEAAVQRTMRWWTIWRVSFEMHQGAEFLKQLISHPVFRSFSVFRISGDLFSRSRGWVPKRRS